MKKNSNETYFEILKKLTPAKLNDIFNKAKRKWKNPLTRSFNIKLKNITKDNLYSEFLSFFKKPGSKNCRSHKFYIVRELINKQNKIKTNDEAEKIINKIIYCLIILNNIENLHSITDNNNNNLLHIAVIKCIELNDIINLLLNSNVDSSALNNNNQTPLSLSLLNRDKKIFNAILSHKNFKCENIIYAIFHSAICNDYPTSKILLEKSNEKQIKLSNEKQINFLINEIQSATCENNMLHIAVNNHNIKMIKLFMNHGADANKQNKFDDTPLSFAVSLSVDNKKEILMTILDHEQYNVDERIFFAIRAAVIKNDVDIFILLLKDAEKLNSDDNFITRIMNAAIYQESRTMLHLPVSYNNSEIAETLLDRGANSNQCNEYSQTLLSLSIRENKNKIFNCIITHKKYKANVNICFSIFEAILVKNIPILKLLIEKSAELIKNNINPLNTPHRSDNNNYSLHYAVQENNLEIVKLLIKNKADIEKINNNGQTAIQIALTRNPLNLKIAIYLILTLLKKQNKQTKPLPLLRDFLDILYTIEPDNNYDDKKISILCEFNFNPNDIKISLADLASYQQDDEKKFIFFKKIKDINSSTTKSPEKLSRSKLKKQEDKSIKFNSL